MKPNTDLPAGDIGVRCAVCATHARPLYVPWQQHAVGCSVRAAELEQRRLALRPPTGAISGFVTS